MVIDVAGPPVLPDDVSDVQTLLLEAYRHIGEPDSVYGACSTHVANDTTRLLLYEHEGEWHKSLSESINEHMTLCIHWIKVLEFF